MTLVNRWYQVIKLLVDHKGMSLQELQEKLALKTVRKNIDTLNDELTVSPKLFRRKISFS